MKNLFNPFEKFQEKTLLLLGIIGIIISTFLAILFNVRFDGLIDIHITENLIWHQPIFDQLINVILLTIFLFILGKIYNKKTRLIDILNAILIARIPFIISIFIISSKTMKSISENILININNIENIQINKIDMTILLLFSIILIFVLIWYFILLWNGFKVATFSKGNKIVIAFILVFIVTYTLSKFIVYTY